jgi:hypothetical protein
MNQTLQEETYQDGAADKYEVPQQVLLAAKPGMSNFQLAQVLIEEVRVKQQS